MITRINNLITTKPNSTSLLAGALLTLGMPPVGAFPVLLLSFPILFLVLQNTTPRTAFVRGFLFVLGFHVCGLYWIASSMLVDAAKFWWAVPLAVLALPAYFALYAGLSCSVYSILKNKLNAPAQPILLSIVLLIAVLAQARILTGFEWNLYGQAWHHLLPVLQTVSLFGIYGLTFLTLLFSFIPIWWWQGNKKTACFFAALFIAFGLWGTYHLAVHPTEYQPKVQLRLVQPNIPQHLKWDPALRDQNFETALRMADLSAALVPTHIIWPEAAVPYIINHAAEARLQLGLRAPGNGLSILGGLWREDQPGQRIYHNSLIAINETGTVTARYDKAHLVPFGEYFPLRKLLHNFGISIDAIAAGSNDFTPGPGQQTLHLKGLPPVSPLICYEVIFSGKVTNISERPAWLLNLTNDAWFGNTSGPHQHFALAQLRAIEEGLPLVRVANTGISGVIDSYGRIMARTNLNEQVTLDHGLPLPAVQQTPFSKFRFWPLFALIALSVLAIFAFCKKPKLTH